MKERGDLSVACSATVYNIVDGEKMGIKTYTRRHFSDVFSRVYFVESMQPL